MNVNYPIKKIVEVLNSLRDSNYFCNLDLFKAYLHLQADEESSIIQTISTHRGTYKMNRLSFGIKTAPAEFNRVIDQILNGLPKTIAYFYDIVVHSKTKDQCSENLFACLERLREYDLHLNIEKCTFFQTRIEYLGHVVENNKISRSPSKVEAIIRMQQPRNVQELRQFLDKQPLSRIFHSKTGLPKMTSARLLRYASFLAEFDYTVKFRKGLGNQNVDCLSRAPANQNCISTDVSINDEVHKVCASAVFEISSENLTADAIIQETEKDQELVQIKRELLSSPINSDYFLDSGILFRNNRIVIPKTLQPTVLNELHSTHIGITKMRQLARRYCIRKNIDKDIENLVKSCKDCSSVKHSPAKAPLHHWD
ncbi:Uncharacterized protein K02A2.6 [Araneus ventricosus]|uniref:RNA-directed DNA polymerase n=1 Tax=Araneus ventricosus TaxID=182803 RepID=A0A4Y2BKS5_ARAVE|nr:Uncharacterized protein K02A2.6 [Araneus ventricosus]